ncbi:hypothetical protein SCLCIDRAFT_1018879 [Scleroderma citrinum Foug A]|uniref:Uncharacterized protein n=1 Tax=Scleroderma citrinum Foug A TaxID=1036808 RepID=A0A0C2ZBZ5_9AGAM|nr:hypothetical protein SCLCIDRAFT_1018879 [Scleroderma citrinum Foug A]
MHRPSFIARSGGKSRCVCHVSLSSTLDDLPGSMSTGTNRPSRLTSAGAVQRSAPGACSMVRSLGVPTGCQIPFNHMVLLLLQRVECVVAKKEYCTLV